MQGAEVDDRMACGRVADVTGIQRSRGISALADSNERRDIGRFKLDLAAQPTLGVALPAGQIDRPFQYVGKRRGLVREVSILLLHRSVPPWLGHKRPAI